jgi:hypothetical protein
MAGGAARNAGAAGSKLAVAERASNVKILGTVAGTERDQLRPSVKLDLKARVVDFAGRASLHRSND